jgi:phage/plasmid-associated DNA primase
MRFRSASGAAAQHQSKNRSHLAPEHREKLRQSALTDQQIDALGWFTGLNGRLQLPYLRPDGTAEKCHDGKPFIRERRTDAEIKANPKGGKYRSPEGNGCRVYHSVLAIAAGNYEARLNDRFTPLRITEGEAKTEAANAHDPKRVTIGLGGVNSWRDRYDGGEESRPLVEFDEIPLHGREVRLCFDSDLDKPQVLAALKGVAELLRDKGAHVLVEVLPHDLNGDRLGVDDLIHRHGPEAFHRIAGIARSPFKTKRQEGQDVLVWAFNPEPLDTRERNTYLASLIGRHWRRSPDGKDRWQQWTGTHWVDVAGDDDLAAAIESFADLQRWKNRELATFRSLQAAFRRTIRSTTNNVTTGIVPFRNGCLRLSDGTLLPHRPEHGNTWALPYDYAPEASCPRLDDFLIDRLGDQASVDVFRAFARSLLTGEWFKVFLEIVGPSNTGKSVLTNLLVALVGSENHSAGKLQRLEDATQRFETLKLKGKRLALFSECQDYSGQLQNLKAITGGDSIAAEIKGGRHVDFTFTGGVVLTGNGPIRASDPTGAVINRRRSLYVEKVVAAGDERQLLEPDGNGGWRGELVAELPGFVNWVLAMPSAAARAALARDVQSLTRMEAELATLLETDYLADWAERHLIWDPSINAEEAEKGFDRRITIGNANGNREQHLYASYVAFVDEQGRHMKPLGLRYFKSKLVDLLRDTLGLPLPSGNPSAASAYRSHKRGSLVPCIRWRTAADQETEAPGVIRHAYQARIGDPMAGMDQEPAGMDGGWITDGKNPVRDSRDGWDGFLEVQAVSPAEAGPEPEPQDPVSPIAPTTSENPSESIPSVPHRVSAIPHPSRRMDASIPDGPLPSAQSRAVPLRRPGRPIRVDGQPGWMLPGTLPKAASSQVMVVDPRGASRCVERRQITEAA